MAAACALAIISGKIIFNRAMPERLRTLRHCIFTGRGRKGKRQLPRLFPAEAAARGERPFRLLTSLAATFPKGTALAVAGNFAVAAQRHPLEGRFPPLRGKMSRSDKKGNPPNAARLKGYFGTTFFRTHFFCTNCLHSVQTTKKSQIFCEISHTHLRKFEQIAKFVCF